MLICVLFELLGGEDETAVVGESCGGLLEEIVKGAVPLGYNSFELVRPRCNTCAMCLF